MENQIAPRADTKITGPNNMSYMSGLPAEVLSSDLTATHIILGQGLSDAVVSKKSGSRRQL
jgi:hypothetical protein